jgi:hypothetical protein
MPTEIQHTIKDDDIEWTMEWPDRPDEQVFEKEPALALMLLNEVVFLNSHWFQEDLPEKFQRQISVNVNCNDVFMWGCADADPLPYAEIDNLYRLWRKGPWGSAIWCMIQRKEMPQKPVENAIRQTGVWDLDALQAEHGLRSNHYDGISGVIAQHKREAYEKWCRENGREPLPFDANWWAGWKEYTVAYPGWCDAAWKAEDDRLCDEWRATNGYRTAHVLGSDLQY